VIDEAVAAIRERTPLVPRATVILGSGLGGFAAAVEGAVEIPYEEIPGWPVSTAIGHSGTLVLGSFAGVPLAVMKGRAHLYEGHSPEKVVFGVRVLGRLGAGVLVFGWLLPLGIGSAVVMGYIVTNHGLSSMTDVNDPMVNSLSVTVPRWFSVYSLQFGLHVEHHLFPTVSGRHAPRIRKPEARAIK